MLRWHDIDANVRQVLDTGCVIPAHPLALDKQGAVDERRQRALSRYYLDAGVGGLAVGVHTTQFAIHGCDLYRQVLEIAAATVDQWCTRPIIKIAGLIGRTKQATEEARLAIALGYHAGLLNVAAFAGAGDDEIIDHCRALAEEIPLVGFYLQPAIGGCVLGSDFWRRFAAIENVIAIKIAAFNRYGTVDVVRGIVEAGAAERITIYTGNDDHIVADLLRPMIFNHGNETVEMRIRGGLLGHWCVWTRRAVELLVKIQALGDDPVAAELLALDAAVTDCNGAFFDANNGFKGCIPGLHEVLRRQGLMTETRCMDPAEQMSPGQAAEIERVYGAYPQLNDDEFVRENLERWLS